MASSADVIVPVSQKLDFVELPFYYLGLNTVTKRFVAGTAIVGGALFSFKPSGLFLEDGTPRPWRATSSDPDAVMLPWWFYSLGTGLILATFI